MTQKNNNNASRSNDWSELFSEKFFFLAEMTWKLHSHALKTLSRGVIKGSIPFFKLYPINLAFMVSYFCGLDTDILGSIPHFGPKIVSQLYRNTSFHLLYKYFCALGSGPIFWAYFKSIEFQRRRSKLCSALRACKLEGIPGARTDLLSDLKIDADTRKMRIRKGIFSEKDFQEAKHKLESILGVFIDQMVDNIEKKCIDIFYSKRSLPSKIEPGIHDLKAAHYILGKTRSSWLSSNFSETPHILIGGQTNGGKSNFLRGFITNLYEKNPSMEFILVDLKEGIEFQSFRPLRRCKIIDSSSAAASTLSALVKQMKQRLAKIREEKCVNIEEYNKQNPKSRLARKIIIIDEAAQLFQASALNNASNSIISRTATESIAALGRAAGYHLVIATQRPDKRSVDTSIKTNLQGRLSFKMADNISSMVILDNNRAKLLPAVPGRAIWQNGLDRHEIQVPWHEPKKIKAKIKELSNETSHLAPQGHQLNTKNITLFDEFTKNN